MTMKYRICVVLLLSFFCVTTGFARTKVIAHRGYWKKYGSAQNSITSLEEADKIKAFGSECDIWITTDHKMIVTHDSKFPKDGKMYEIATSSYDDLKGALLSNGETLPTLDDYLTVGKQCKHTKLILELKTHPSKELSLLLAKQVLEKVKAYKLKKKVEYIAFSIDIAKEIIRLDPKAKVHYLNGELSPKELKQMGFAGLDYHINVYKKNPDWIDEAHKLGLKVNVWSVNDDETMRFFIEKGADYITTDEPEQLQLLLINRPVDGYRVTD